MRSTNVLCHSICIIYSSQNDDFLGDPLITRHNNCSMAHNMSGTLFISQRDCNRKDVFLYDKIGAMSFE